MISSLCALTAGMGMPIQTSINANLGKKAGSPFLAALINFAVGICALIIAALIMERSLAIPFGNIGAAPAWVLFGGAFAVVFVVGNILLMPRLGSIQTVILPSLGQIIMGTLIDTFGIFGAETRNLTILRALGVIIVFCGVVIVILSKNKGKDSHAYTQHAWLWRAFGVFEGCCMACQTAVNSQLGLVVGSRVYAAIINFSVGLSILAVLSAVLIVLGKKKPDSLEGKTPLWIWMGGLIGAWYCIGNIITGQILGTGMAVILVLTGLMAGGLIVDQTGMFRSAKRPVRAIEVLGVIIMLAGAAMFHLL